MYGSSLCSVVQKFNFIPCRARFLSCFENATHHAEPMVRRKTKAPRVVLWEQSAVRRHNISDILTTGPSIIELYPRRDDPSETPECDSSFVFIDTLVSCFFVCLMIDVDNAIVYLHRNGRLHRVRPSHHLNTCSFVRERRM